MPLADALWWSTTEGGTADDETWEKALAEVRRQVDNGSDRLFTVLPIASHSRGVAWAPNNAARSRSERHGRHTLRDA